MKFIINPANVANVAESLRRPKVIDPYEVVGFKDGSVLVMSTPGKAFFAKVGGYLLLLAGVALLIYFVVGLIRGENLKFDILIFVGLLVGFGLVLLFVGNEQKSLRFRPEKGVVHLEGKPDTEKAAKRDFDSVQFTIAYSKPTTPYTLLVLCQQGKRVFGIAESAMTHTLRRALDSIAFAVWVATKFDVPLEIEFLEETAADPRTQPEIGDILNQLLSEEKGESSPAKVS